MTARIISLSTPPPKHDYTTVPICLQCINSYSWNPALIPLLNPRTISCLEDDSDCQSGPQQQSHYPSAGTQTEKHSNQYCTLLSVWPLRFLPARQISTQRKRTFILNKVLHRRTAEAMHVSCKDIISELLSELLWVLSPLFLLWNNDILPPSEKNKEIRQQSDWIWIFDSHCVHLCKGQTNVYLCSDWLVAALSDLCRANWVVRHTSAIPPEQSISLSLLLLCKIHFDKCRRTGCTCRTVRRREGRCGSNEVGFDR